jgi:ketosteroid isomerase-like protein
MRENMRPAFLANFADDGVFVRSGWINSNAFLATRPDPPITLDWRPAYVEVAASGELGFSTGPTKLTSTKGANASPSYGQYCSVWRRNPAGAWKVEVDLGINHPGPALWGQPLEATTVAGARGAGSEATLRTAEENFARAARDAGPRAAHAALASERLRFYRNDAPPAIGKAAALTAPGMSDERMAWRVERAAVARSGDLGYARGSYASAASPGTVLGHYLRIWRLEGGAWRVALDVANPLATP